MFESRESKISVGISFIILAIAAIMANLDGHVGLPLRTAFAMFIMILGTLWLGMAMGIDIEKENNKKKQKEESCSKKQ